MRRLQTLPLTLHSDNDFVFPRAELVESLTAVLKAERVTLLIGQLGSGRRTLARMALERNEMADATLVFQAQEWAREELSGVCQSPRIER